VTIPYTDRDAWREAVGTAFEIFDIRTFGARSGGTDCTPARNKAVIAAKGVSGAVIYYPPGFWHHTTSPTALTDSCGIIFQGAGRNVTHIVLGASGVKLFDLGNVATRVQIRDLWMGSFDAKADGYGVRAISSTTPISEVILERITIQNLPYPLYYDNVHQCAMRDLRVIQSVAGATVGQMLYMVDSVTHRLQDLEFMCLTGTVPSDMIRIDSDCDTIVGDGIALSFFTNGGGAGIRCMNSVGGGATGPRLVRFTDTYVENAGSSGFLVDDGRDIRFRGCHSATATLSGFAVTGGDSINFTDCFAALNQQHGYVATGGDGLKFDGCTATDNSQQTHNTYNGIHIENDVVGARIIGCRSGDFIYATGKNQKYGVHLGAGSSNYLFVVGCDLRGNATGSLNNTSTGANNVILANSGVESKISDALYAAPGVPAAPVAATYRAPLVPFRDGSKSTTSTSDASITAFTLKGGTLGTAFSAVRITAGGRQTTQAGSFNVKFGATVLCTVTPAAGASWHVDVILTRAGSAVETATGLTVTGATVASVSAIPGETLSGDITIDFRGSVTSGGTLSLDNAMVEYLSHV
jgi:hypothetical protein